MRYYELAELDAPPRPVGDTAMEFPPSLERRRIRGRIVVLVELGREGEVEDAHIDSSSLASFDDFVLGEVRKWRFTPPTREGRPVKARARVPLEIRIR